MVEIRPKDRNVRIKVNGEISIITFDTKAAGGPGPANATAGIPRLPGPPGAPGVRNFAAPGTGFTPGNGGVPVPVRPVRTTSSDNSYVAPQSTGGGGYLGGYAQAAMAANSSGGNVNIPASLFNTPQSAPQPAQNSQAPSLSAEEQVAISLVQQQMHKAEIEAGTFPQLPPLPGVPVVAAPKTSGAAAASEADSSSGPPMPTLPSFDNSSSAPPMPTLPRGYKATGSLAH